MDTNAFVSSADDLKSKLPWGKGKDVWVAYNGKDGGPITDVFVHFHGFLPTAFSGKDAFTVLSSKSGGKVMRSGMQDKKGGALAGVGTNTLMIIPCGKQVSTTKDYVITTFEGMDLGALVEASIAWCGDNAGVLSEAPYKLTCTGHSGGGQALRLITYGKLGSMDPTALHYYDATYKLDKKHEKEQKDIEAKLKAWGGRSGKEVCVAYIDGSGTADFAKTIESWGLSKSRIAKAKTYHDDVPHQAFPYFHLGKSPDGKMDPATCKPL